MKRHFETHYADKKRKPFEATFVNMCFNSSVGLVGGTVLQDWNAVSKARDMALHVDCVHLNERAIALLVEALTAWLENLQEEVYLEKMKAAYASASPRKSSVNVDHLSASLVSLGLTKEEEAKAEEKEGATVGPSGAGTVVVGQA